MVYKSDPKFWQHKRICVTGGAGFLGSFLLEALKKRGATDVFVPRIEEYDLVNPQDIQRLLDLSQPDIIIHLAALAGGIGANRARPADFFYINLMKGVQLIHEACKRNVGETEADFELLLHFLQQAQLDRVGCFSYSPVAGAKANELDGAVPEAVNEERWHRFMQAQAAISRARLQAKVGSTQPVLVDAVDADGAGARSRADAPEIDGVVTIRDGTELRPGDLVEVIVEAADDYDLTARLAC